MKTKRNVLWGTVSLMVMTVISGVAYAQVTVNLTPYNPPIQVSSSGGSFEYNIAVTNPGGSSQTFDVWCMITLPNGSSYGPVLGPVNLTMPGGASNNRDRIQDVPATAPEGSYTFNAYTGDYPDVVWSSDSFPFEKLPSSPDTLWTQTFGGNDHDHGESVQQTTDGGFIIAGYTTSYGAGYADVYLVKTDGSGNEEWSQTFGGNSEDQGYSVRQTNDGGYVIVGRTMSYGAGYDDVYLIKTDASGNEEWYQTFGGSDDDCGESVQQTGDGGYIITGYTETYGAGERDVYLIKTDASGNEEWYQTHGGSDWDYGWSVQQTQDEGYIIAGETASYGVGFDVYLIKTDVAGNEEWYQTHGGSYFDAGLSVQQTADGGYIVTGRTLSYGAGPDDVYLVKTDASGSEEWIQIFGGGRFYDVGNSVQQTTDGGYIIAGWTDFNLVAWLDVYLIKTNSLGSEEWSQMIGGDSYDRGLSVQQTEDGGYIVAGYTNSYGAGNTDVYLIRIAAETAVNRLFGVPPAAEILVTPSDYSLSQNYPNPFNPVTTISFELPTVDFVHLAIYDVSGSLVTELIDGHRDAGTHTVTFDASHLASGIYVYQIEVGDFSDVKKMVLMK